jgi:microcystin-dependent protein
MPSHNHTASDSGHSHTVNYHGSGAEASGYGLVGSAGFQNRVGVSTSGGDSSNTSWANITVASTGSTTPWSQMPPLSVVNFIIKS